MKRLLPALTICLVAQAFPGLKGQDLSGSEVPVVDTNNTAEFEVPASKDITTPSSVSFPESGTMDTDAYAPDAPQLPDMSYMGEKISSEIFRMPVYYKRNNVSVYPFLNSCRNHYNGIDVMGIGSSFRLSDRVTGGLDLYTSSVYFGTYQPRPYLNIGVSGHIDLKVSDNFYLIGLGGHSVRKGLDPQRVVNVGGTNYLGVGMHIQVSENVGFSITHTWHRYDGKWHGRYGFAPSGPIGF